VNECGKIMNNAVSSSRIKALETSDRIVQGILSGKNGVRSDK
jgi:hypothetical protein